MGHVDKLKELTTKLPSLILKEDRNLIEYESKVGSICGFGLLSEPAVAVQQMVLSDGAIFPPHVHDREIEYGIVYKGSLNVTIDDESRTIGAGDVIKFEKGEVHSAVAEGEVRLIAVSIPRIDGYPHP